MKQIISTNQAPKAIGTYSQAVKVGQTVYLSGQIPLDPVTMNVVSDDFKTQAIQTFKNLSAVIEAAGGNLSDVVKMTIYLIQMDDFPIVNEVMAQFFKEPYPARAVVAIKELPKKVSIEMDAIVYLSE